MSGAALADVNESSAGDRSKKASVDTWGPRRHNSTQDRESFERFPKEGFAQSHQHKQKGFASNRQPININEEINANRINWKVFEELNEDQIKEQLSNNTGKHDNKQKSIFLKFQKKSKKEKSTTLQLRYQS